MSDPAYDQDFWEALWSKTLREREAVVASRAPNACLLNEAGALSPGLALDAGCGHGADARWLAAHGWQVDAVDFSASALEHARAQAERDGEVIAARLRWIEADLSAWTPPPQRYGLVVCLYVHAADGAEALARRMASAVAPGGTLLMVGHQPVDPDTGAPTRAAGQTQISIEAARAALDPARWTLLIAETRPRPRAGEGVDAVILAQSSIVS